MERKSGVKNDLNFLFNVSFADNLTVMPEARPGDSCTGYSGYPDAFVFTFARLRRQ
jgi:hypothetical protein